MADLQMLSELFRHMEWADARMWQAVFATPLGASDAGFRQRLHHIHLVQHAFLGVWTEQPLKYLELTSFENLAAVAAWGRRGHQERMAWLATVDESTLQRHVTLPWADLVEAGIGQPPAPSTLSETMLQVAMHSTHHRGQVNLRLRELGAEPPMTDFIAWVWLGKPQPDWSVLQSLKSEV